MTRSASAQMICKLYISGFSNDVCLMISCLLNVMELFRMKNSVEFDFNYGRSGFQLFWLILCNFTVCNSHNCNFHLFFHLDYNDQNTIKSKIYSIVKVYCFLCLPKKTISKTTIQPNRDTSDFIRVPFSNVPLKKISHASRKEIERPNNLHTNAHAVA